LPLSQRLPPFFLEIADGNVQQPKFLAVTRSLESNARLWIIGAMMSSGNIAMGGPASVSGKKNAIQFGSTAKRSVIFPREKKTKSDRKHGGN
jgi:hypothetical protein